MTDLIDRQAAIDAKQEFRNPNVVRNTEARTAYDRTYANGWNDCNSAWINAIKALPSAQPEIIRCGECKHCYIDGENVRFNVCELNHNKAQSDDWFCADAERRTDDSISD